MQLIFESYNPTSINEFCTFYQSKEMMRYIGDGKIYSDEQCKIGLQVLLKKYKKDSNQGHWAVFNDNEYIGKALLLPWDNSIDFELGYGVLPSHWGKGYGFEIAQKMLNLAKEDGHQSLIATVHRKNKASIKILKKLGFKYKKIVKKQGRKKDLYSWSLLN